MSLSIVTVITVSGEEVLPDGSVAWVRRLTRPSATTVVSRLHWNVEPDGLGVASMHPGSELPPTKNAMLCTVPELSVAVASTCTVPAIV